MLEKNILGSWGANLPDSEYAHALAAYGVLAATGIARHAPAPDPAALRAELRTRIASGERTAVWPGAMPASDLLYYDAAALAQAWLLLHYELYHFRDVPRIAVPLELSRDASFPFQSLIEWLNHPELALGSLMIEAPVAGEATRVGWHWPLRVGFLAGGDPSLRTALEIAKSQHDWIGALVQWYPVGDTRDRCDLLLLSAADFAAIRSERRLRLRASCAVIFEQAPRLDIAAELHAALAARLGTAAIAWVGQPASQQGLADWLQDVFREVSHDVPISTALTKANGSHPENRPLIIGRAHLADRCRILAIADHQDRLVAALSAGSEPEPSEPFPYVPPSSGIGTDDPAQGPARHAGAITRGVFGPGPGGTFGEDFEREFRSAPAEPAFGGGTSFERLPTPLDGISAEYADALRNRAFTQESVDGVQSKSELAERQEKIGAALPPRWIQANGWRTDTPANAARHFAENQWNLLAIHIGPSATPRSDSPFVSTGLDFSQGDLPVVVQVEIGGTHVQAMAEASMKPADLQSLAARSSVLANVAKLLQPAVPQDAQEFVGLSSSTVLLPATGDSTLALFAVNPDPGQLTHRGRISIIHGNRVLQTATLDLETRERLALNHAAHVFGEARIHARDDDLEDRRHYDVAIGVSDVGGKLHLTIQQGDVATPAALSNLAQPIANIRESLRKIAEDFDYALPMRGQAAFDTNLYVLAAHGKTIENHLRAICGDDIDGWQHINLVTQTSEFFPLEYVYAGTSPDLGARTCPNMEKALAKGDCRQALRDDSPASPPCPHLRDSAYVCPVQFWAFHRAIERSRGMRGAATMPDAELQATTVRVPSKQPFGRVSSLVFAASERAFAYAQAQHQQAERDQVVAALQALWQPIPKVSDWKQWASEVVSGPNVLVLIVHTDAYLTVPVLEIGKSQWLPQNKIERGIIGHSKRPRLLLLLGCSTAGVQNDFQPYPELFHVAGADIVLANVGVVRGRDAAEIVKHLSGLLATKLKSADATSFGEMLPQVRRELLAAGHPGVLGLVGFGDGDWLLGGPDAAA